MNVLFLTTHLNSGGITSYLMTLIKGLASRGHQVHLASSGGEMEKELQYVGAHTLTLNIRTKSELDPRIYFALSPLKRYIEENRIDVIHAHTRITQVMGALLEKITHRTMISTCHGFFKRRLMRRIFPCWGKYVIAISAQVQEHLQKDFRVPAAKISLVENGIDLDRFPLVSYESKLDNRKQYQLEKGPLIGIIARLSDVKGHDVLIKAMKKIIEVKPDVRLAIVGVGKTEEELKKLVQSLGLGSHVLFYPVTNRSVQFLSMLDCFVMPSRQEGLGLSVMEAQACGLAVVASGVGGILSLIADGKTGVLVPPDDVEALAKAVMGLLSDPARASSIGLSARRFITENYSSEKMVHQTLNLYQKVIFQQHA